MKNISIYLIILLLAACKVSKDVKTPEGAVPATFRDTPADTAGIGKMPWASFFNNPELNTLIAAAIEHNNDLQVAVKDIEAAELTLRQAKLGNVPNVGLQANTSISRYSDNSLNGATISQFLSSSHVEDYTLAVSLSWEADLWGKIRSRKASALASYLQTNEARKAVQTRIVSDVAKGYYNLLMLDAQLSIARQNVLLNDSTLNIIQLQYQSGQVTLLAVQQAQAQKLTAAALVPQFEQLITIQENAISILSGVNPAAVHRQKDLASLPLAEKLSAGIPADLLALRPDVRLAELALQKANAEVGYAKANMYPSLAITAQGGLDAVKLSNWFTIPASLFGIAAGSLTQPLFQQKKLSTLYEVAKVRREQTVISFRQSVLVAAGEVADNLVKIDKLQQQQAFTAERVSTLKQAIQNAQQLFGNGMATYLEVITAQANVLQSELELAGIKKAQLDAGVDLYRAVGGGWQ
jgi:NodT family efflux transporter outer membrane factor (OMF) lipoprotein